MEKIIHFPFTSRDLINLNPYDTLIINVTPSEHSL